MKSRFVFFALLAGAATASATPSANAILTLLNTDAAQNPKVYAAAAARVRSEAEAGKTLQRFVLAVLSADPACPRGIRLDPGTRHVYLESARPRIRQLAEKWNNPLAWYLISLEKNDFGALRRAADGGNVQALNALGTFRLQEALATPGPSTNALAAAAEAFACFRRAAGRNDANALYNLGMCYLQGYGCPIDQRLAFESFRTAADAGHTEAINNIGGCYRDGIVVTRDPVLAARWFAKSAELGNPYGELNYARALQHGDGVAKDEARAAGLLKSAAGRGCVEAMNAYGMCVGSGRGVEPNPTLAVYWFRRAAAAGFPPAMENLAASYESGRGVDRKDATAALVWHMRARAARGDRAARDWLAANGHALKETP